MAASAGGGAGSASNTMLSGPKPTIVPSGILIHPAVWPQQIWAENLWGLRPFFGKGELGRGYLSTKWHLDPSGRLPTTYMGRKNRGLWPFGGAGSPSSTMWPGRCLTPYQVAP